MAHFCNHSQLDSHRWLNQLSPNVRKDPWTEEEDAIIVDAHKKLGNKWVAISKLLVGRPPNAVKNRWNGTLHRKAASMSHSASDSALITASSMAHTEPKHIPIRIERGEPRHPIAAAGNGFTNGGFSGSSMGIATRRSKRTRPLRSEDEESDEEYKEASSDDERRKRRRSAPSPHGANSGGLVRSQSHPLNLNAGSSGNDISRLLAVAAAAESPPSSMAAQQLQYQQMLLHASNQLAHMGFGGPTGNPTEQAAAAAQFYAMNPLFPFLPPHTGFQMVNQYAAAAAAAAAAKFPAPIPNNSSGSPNSTPTLPSFFAPQANPWFDPNAFMVAAAMQQQRANSNADPLKPLAAASGLSALAATATNMATQPGFPLRFNLIILDPSNTERNFADVVVNSTAHLSEFAAVATGTVAPVVEIFIENQQKFVPLDALLSVLGPTENPDAPRTLRLRVQHPQKLNEGVIKPEAASLAAT